MDEYGVCTITEAGLTLTWDVFKSRFNISNSRFKKGLTLTWNVFKFL